MESAVTRHAPLVNGQSVSAAQRSRQYGPPPLTATQALLSGHSEVGALAAGVRAHPGAGRRAW
jgi:hypothetical protein